MLEIYKRDKSVCYPITIGPYVDKSSNRIGGNAPERIRSSDITENNRYFFTLALERSNKELDVSLFINESFDFYYDNRGRAMYGDNKNIDIVVHEPSSLSENPQSESLLSLHSLYICDEDFDSEDMEQIWTHHKIGGVPYFKNRSEELLTLIKNKQTEGYRHVLQLAFPDADDAHIKGTWPFHDTIFHLFCKQEDETYKFLCIWS